MENEWQGDRMRLSAYQRCCSWNLWRSNTKQELKAVYIYFFFFFRIMWAIWRRKLWDASTWCCFIGTKWATGSRGFAHSSHTSGTSPVNLWGFGDMEAVYVSIFPYFQNDSRDVLCFRLQSCERRHGEPSCVTKGHIFFWVLLCHKA